MGIVAFLEARLSVVVFLLGLAIYFFIQKLTKASVSEVARIMIFTGLLAFLMAAGNSMQSCSTTPTSSASHR
jgi:hypothetical protein